MTRRLRIVRNTGIGIAALLIIAFAAGLITIRTAWFRGYVARDIVSSVEKSTGGRAGIGSFDFDVSRLRVTIGDLVIHGREPAGTPPLLRVSRIIADFRVFPHFTKFFDIRYLSIDRPQADVRILADGRTNIPSPKQKTVSKESPLQTVVNLAVKQFELKDGTIAVESRKQPLNVSAENLVARLAYNTAHSTYSGAISLQPVYVIADHNTPVVFTISLPLTIASDRIDVRGGTVSTAASGIRIDASFEDVKSPRIAARVAGSVAITDLKNAADLPLAINTRGIPASLDLNADLSESGGVIRISDFAARIGKSSIEASGASDQAIAFHSNLDMAELGRLMKAKTVPGNPLSASGDIRTDGDLRDLYLTDFTVNAFGGWFSGSASLRDMRNYKIDATLRDFDIGTVLRAMHERVPYDGVISGSLNVDGALRDTRELIARTHLTVAPGKRGKPVSGSIEASYDGASGNVVFGKSFLALPHSRVDVSGVLDRALNVSLKSTDLSDFPGTNGLALNRGQADFNGSVTGVLTSPRIAGHLAMNHLAIEGREFNSLGADLSASSTGLAVRKGFVMRSPMRADFSASVGLARWRPLPREPLTARASIDQGDLADIVALAGMNPSGYGGAFRASAEIGGTIGNPAGTINARADNGLADGIPFDEAQLQANLTDRLASIPAAYIRAGAGDINLSAEFRHPRDSFTTGQVHAVLRTNDIDLSKTAPTGRPHGNLSGSIRIDADLVGDLNSKRFKPSAVNANVSGRMLRFEGQNYGDVQASARTSGQTVAWNFNSDFAGSSLRANGQTQLVSDYPTTADAEIGSLSVEKALTAVRRTDIQARGTLSGSIHFAGTIPNPQGEANLVLTRGAIQNEPIDELQLRAAYMPQSIDVSELRISSGPSRIDLTAHYDHPAGDLLAGDARFDLESSRIDLARIRNIQVRRPGLTGTLQLSAKGDGTVVHGNPRIQLHDLALNLSASGIAARGKNFGDLKLTANSAPGGKIEFALDSDLAGASIHGRGSGTLTTGYPVDAQISFNNVLYSHFASLLGKSDEAHRSAEIAADGELTVNGPVLLQDQLRANLQLTRLNLTANEPAGKQTVTIANQGPVSIALDHGQVRIQNAHLAGGGTDLQASGSASLTARTLDFALGGKADLGVLSRIDRDIYSSGQIDLQATVRGAVSQPLVDGQLTLQNAALNYAGLPAGISKASGEIAFDGNRATLRNLTGEVGGGKLTLSGFVSYSDQLRFALQAKATRVRALVQQGIRVTASTDLQLTGTGAGSVVSGTAVIDQLSYTPQTDIGTLLSRATPVAQAVSTESPLLGRMKLDIKVTAASSLSVQAQLAENVSATVDLHVRGTAAQPGIVGRITINEGKLVFFGATYTVNTGIIAFYNPFQINPIIDLRLETQTQGVEVVVRVTGPMDNLKLSFSSNPPLQFQEIVSLLATGKTPTSDPTLLANQAYTPPGSVQQMGESAVLGEAVANPVANRLQRVFGVSSLNIAPAFQPGSETPTARITLQQHVTSNLTFIYTSAFDDPNGEIVSVEWTFDPRWSAVATRDQNGIFSINFLYKRQFH